MINYNIFHLDDNKISGRTELIPQYKEFFDGCFHINRKEWKICNNYKCCQARGSKWVFKPDNVIEKRLIVA